MASLKTISLAPLNPSYPVHVALYRDLQNAPFLRQQLISGNSDFEYAFIDARMVLSCNHILAAIYRAVQDYTHKRLKSNNVHSEIVFALSPNNNIAEAFRKFGITDATKDLLVVKASTAPEITHDTVAQHLEKAIEGIPCEFNDENLHATSRYDEIKKIYKLNSMNVKLPHKPDGVSVGPAAGSAEEIDGLRRIETSILGSIALRGAN
ncbi:hypothetical protein AJ80_08266 [Polytolypa hystricis UAMH7299]|uniref:EKC/KEOPS complex subunit CGI121 n=1 Tax=Polytolypa hystricis (strain UAMH7299) TaxID=1447883 RepID=A0A2B7XAZ4_POLH7|nr:hypothetical protein AJ80_08266 [Polytolypa hystricis UAMH7299]